MIDETTPVSRPEVVKEEEFVDLLARLEFHKANLHLIRFTEDRDEAADIFTASAQIAGAQLGRPEVQQRLLHQGYIAFLTACFRPFKEDDPQDIKDHALRQKDLMFGYLNTAFDSNNPDEVRVKLRKIEKATKGSPYSAQEINEARGTIIERFRDFGSYSPKE